MKPSVLAVCFYSSRGAVADNFYSVCGSLAEQSRLSILSSPLLQERDLPGTEAACYLDFPKQKPLAWLDPFRWNQLVRFARRTQYDLVFLYSEHPLHAAVCRVARAKRSLFWCLDPAPHSGSASAAVAIYEMSKRLLVQQANRTVVACEGMRQDVIGRYEVSGDRVISCFHGILENLVFPLDQSRPRDIDVLFFGRLEAYKGIDVLVEALRLLKARGRTPATTVAGPGTFPIPADAGITVVNRYLEDRELAELVARAKIVVMPYRDATGSQVPQTAAVYGTPVVATAVGCLPEYVQDGVTGLIVPPADAASLSAAIEKLLGDEELWRRMSQRAAEAARTTFSNDRLTATLLEQALR
jgi:glycosyltransferase involved in cell wall biosynthesis